MRIHILQHVPYENPGLITHWAKERGFPVSFTRFYENDHIPSPENFDLLVVMGGPMNIYETEKYSWLAKEKLFLQTCLAAKKKMLGVCLGSQLLADALGAKVFPNKEKEIGWFPIHINGNHPLLNVFPEDVIPAFHWHGDTFEIPRNAIPIFYSEATKNQGFVFDNHVFALQFHWEIEPGSLKQLTQHASGDLTSGKYIQTVDKMLNNASGFESSRHHLWGLLNFIQAL